MCYLFYNTSWSAVIKCMCVWLATCLEETPPQFRSQLEVLLYMWKKLLGRVFLVGPSVKCMLSVLIHHYVRTSDGFWWCYESSIHDPAVHVLRMCGLECEVLSAVKKPVYQGHREKASERRYLESGHSQVRLVVCRFLWWVLAVRGGDGLRRDMQRNLHLYCSLITWAHLCS